MSFQKPPRSRGRNGRSTAARFVEVEIPAAISSHLVIEAENGRILDQRGIREALHADLTARPFHRPV